MIYTLPESIEVCGVEYDINSDFRCILDVMEVLSDEELTSRERIFYALGYFYPDFESIPSSSYQDAIKSLFWFVNGGQDSEPEQRKPQKLMDWGQDFPYIIGPVNHIIGHEIRSDTHLHWWTFLSAYMDIGECLFSQVVSIRQKLASHKKLDKAEREWYKNNRKLVDLKSTHTYSSSELEFMRMIGGEQNVGN